MKKHTGDNHLWKVFWILDGVVKETLPKEGRRVPKYVAQHIANEAKHTTHKMGTLEVVPDYEKPEDRFQPLLSVLDILNKQP